MTLRDGIIKNTYQVASMDLEQATKIRLQTLGLTNGTKVTILNKKRSGSVILYVRDTRFAIGKEIAESILIKQAHTPSKLVKI